MPHKDPTAPPPPPQSSTISWEPALVKHGLGAEVAVFCVQTEQAPKPRELAHELGYKGQWNFREELSCVVFCGMVVAYFICPVPFKEH